MKIVYPLLVLIALAACNTIEGAGKDVSAAGHAVTNEAQDTKQGM